MYMIGLQMKKKAPVFLNTLTAGVLFKWQGWTECGKCGSKYKKDEKTQLDRGAVFTIGSVSTRPSLKENQAWMSKHGARSRLRN